MFKLVDTSTMNNNFSLSSFVTFSGYIITVSHALGSNKERIVIIIDS